MIDQTCGYCRESMEPDYTPPYGASPARLDGWPAHNECGLRSVVGGIGHLANHAYWCKVVGDPDAGLSYRRSAELVWQWIRDYGIEAAVAISSE